jgi:hypothetical protein
MADSIILFIRHFFGSLLLQVYDHLNSKIMPSKHVMKKMIESGIPDLNVLCIGSCDIMGWVRPFHYIMVWGGRFQDLLHRNSCSV